jgi:hypothetical protein
MPKSGLRQWAADYDALRYSNLIEDIGSESVSLERDQVAPVHAPPDSDMPRRLWHR